MFTVGIDIGGTNTAAGIVENSENITHRLSVKTDHDYHTFLKNTGALITNLLSDADLSRGDITLVGTGCPGICNQRTGLVEYSNNLGWKNVPLEKDLADVLGLPVYVDNDANAAAFGEFTAGVAKGLNTVVVLTLGTGVGSGIIIDKKLYYGENFGGGELGHMVIEQGGLLCSCGRKGCFEKYASATGLGIITRNVMEKYPDSAMHTIAESQGKVNARTAFIAKRQGDKAGTEAVDIFVKYLACGITNVINIFQPDAVCIGGGVSGEGEYLLEPLRKVVNSEAYSRDSDFEVKLYACKLGNEAGIIGAANSAYCRVNHTP
ncbi:MAG: ROK family protein [Oscillospiraceae bacterium]|jgi:glucokinase|nr:ROK family protein [Oscillospiraceae bacterium]